MYCLLNIILIPVTFIHILYHFMKVDQFQMLEFIKKIVTIRTQKNN